MSYVSSNIGYNLTTLFDASDIYEILNIEKNHSYSLPDWVTPIVYDQLREINNLVFWLHFSTKPIQKLRSGMLRQFYF